MQARANVWVGLVGGVFCQDYEMKNVFLRLEGFVVLLLIDQPAIYFHVISCTTVTLAP